MPEELDGYQDKGNTPNWWDMSLEFGIACMSSKLNRGQCRLFPREQFAGGTIHVVYHGHNILLFLSFFL